MLIKGHVVTVKGDNLSARINNKGIVLEIEHNHNDEELNNFEIVVVVEENKTHFDFDPYSNLNVNATKGTATSQDWL